MRTLLVLISIAFSSIALSQNAGIGTSNPLNKLPVTCSSMDVIPLNLPF